MPTPRGRPPLPHLERNDPVANSFGGGLKVKRGKRPTLDGEILKSDIITLKTAASRPLALAVGDPVGRGGLVAAPFEGKAALFSGISGTVKEIREESDGKAVVIARDPHVPDAAPLSPVEGKLADMSREALSDLLLSRGVTPPDVGEYTIKHLVVDCAGDDPFNESREALFFAAPGEVVAGAKILMKLLSARHAVFAVSRDRLAAADLLRDFIPKGSRMLKAAFLRRKFPQSEPRLLVSALFNLEIHPASSVEKIGYTVVSPMLCKAVFDALAKGIPYTDATLTLAEEPLSHRALRVLTVPFGTPLSEILAYGDPTLRRRMRLTVGGGYRAQEAELDDPVTPDTEAVSLLFARAKKRFGVCIGCGRCHRACPMRLAPSLLYEAALADREKAAKRLDIDACIGCGACTAVCPAGLPLAETVTAYRAALTGGPDEA
ncbi:MAG: 4Fe-4S dicluster domain-containing protein [Ruminococcaceae bacterium]|nr:4Fe-4S dicluster domain-containing protein [Oscillospiraceae bacterium]